MKFDTEIVKIFPIVNFRTGKHGSNCVVYIDGQEMKTVESINVSAGYGKTSKVTLVFDALIDCEEENH